MKNAPDESKKEETTLTALSKAGDAKNDFSPEHYEDSNNRKSGKPRHNPKAKNKDAVKRITANELSNATIRRKTISDTLQHPATILPLAMAIMSSTYLILLSPIFGEGMAAVVIASISGTAAVGSYLINYQREHDKNSRELSEIVETKRVLLEEEELKHLEESLQSGFLSIESAEGSKILKGLVNEYTQLLPALRQPRTTDSLSMSFVPALAGETFRRGLSVLSDALDLMNVIHAPGSEKLEKEISEMDKEIEALREDQGLVERLNLKETILISLKERLARMTYLQLHTDQLLFQAQRCEAALHSTRIELATIRAGSSKSSVDSVIEIMLERIRQVKEIQDEITRMGY